MKKKALYALFLIGLSPVLIYFIANIFIVRHFDNSLRQKLNQNLRSLIYSNLRIEYANIAENAGVFIQLEIDKLISQSDKKNKTSGSVSEKILIGNIEEIIKKYIRISRLNNIRLFVKNYSSNPNIDFKIYPGGTDNVIESPVLQEQKGTIKHKGKIFSYYANKYDLTVFVENLPDEFIKSSQNFKEMITASIGVVEFGYYVLFIVLAVVLAAIIILLSLYFSKHITRPLSILTDKIGEATKKNQFITLDIKTSQYEILELIKAFNIRSIKLKDYYERLQKKNIELEELNKNLELKIEERISELKKAYGEIESANNELQKNNAELFLAKKNIEFILGATKTGLDIIDSDFNIRYIDPEWKTKYGEINGKKCYEYFMGNASICNGCGVSIALQTKKITVTEEILFKENNRHIQVTSIPFQDSKSGEWLAAEVNVDITDRKLLEDNLKENWDIQNSINQILKISLEEMKLENILEKILDIIFQTKYIRDFYKCSIFLTDRTKPGLLFLKASRNALDNKTFQNCELLEFGKCLCGKCAAEKKMIYKSSMDEDHYFKMEGAFDHAHYCFPILNKDDAIGVLNFVIPKNTEIQESQIQFLFAVSDIISNIVTGKWNDEELALKTNLTQKYAKEIQESYMMLKQTQQQLILSDKMAAIGTLSAGIAHEINNPVAYIKGNIITLEKYMNGMLKLINEFLSLSNNNSFGAELKKLAAESDLNFISSDIPELIKETKEGVEKVITIVKSMKSFIRKGKDGIEKADINKILENSLVIAKSQIKNKIRIEKKLAVLPEIPCYSNQIEQVFLNLIINSVQAIGKEGIIKIETFAEYDKIIIKIQDTGSGIPAHLINKIFEPFFTTKEVGKGTGLGLSIVYDIISNHGGEITVESKPDEGTVFKISLPTHNVAKKKRILIVEDNENIKGLLFDLLKTTYNVKCACDGFEAGKLVYDFIPDAILLDIMLPGINGMDICEMLRKDAVFKNIIIIAVTASIHTDAEFFKAGFNAVIRKPFSIEEILKTLEKLLE